MVAEMIRQISLHRLIDQIELIPQAIVDQPVAVVAKRFSLDPEVGHDDLDDYEGIAFLLNGSLRFALMHHKGYPNDTATIYLSDEIRDVGTITELIRKITRELEIPASSIRWQRKDAPHL